MSRWRDLYTDALSHRDNLGTQLQLPVGLTSALAAGLATMWQAYSPFQPIVDRIFFAGLIGSSVAVVATAYFLLRFYHGHTYRLVPSPGEMRAHETALANWHRDIGSASAAATDFDNWCDDKYVDAGEANYFVNLVKSEYLFRARVALVISLLCGFLAFIPYIQSRTLAPPPTYAVCLTPCSQD